eukprot:g18750.t1
MTMFLGLAMVFGLVFGGFMLSGGKMDIVLHALPFEGMMIGGASLGSFVIANSFSVIKGAAKGVGKVVKGPKWKGKDYNDLLALMYELTRIYKAKGILALDDHIENPKESEIFQRYPKILKDHFALDLIRDSFRMLSMQFDDKYATEDVINRKIKKHHHEALEAAHAIQSMADGLPAIGIVAAVLGVIKTMSSIDQPPEVLGAMIGGALVGTFLGVFLAYCMVQPISGRLTQIEDEDGAFYHVIRDIFVAMVSNQPPNICVEIGRGNIPTRMQPDFYEEEAEPLPPEAAPQLVSYETADEEEDAAAAETPIDEEFLPRQQEIRGPLMSAKRRRALSLMERLRGLDIDEVKRDMADLRRQMTALKEGREDLRERLKRERLVSSPEAQPYIAAFVQSVTAEMRRIEAKMLEIEPQLIRYENQLRELYREQKVYETVRVKDLRDEQREHARREQQEIEEMTILRWNR